MADYSSEKMIDTIPLSGSVIFGSSEAFFGPVFQYDDVLAVPYANVRLLNYNYENCTDPWIDKCLFISFGTTKFRSDDQINTVGGTSEDGFIVLGGEPMVSPAPWHEADFYSVNPQLILFESSEVSEIPFSITEAELLDFFIETDWQSVFSKLLN